MTVKQTKELIALLKSGDFTIAYHDRGSCDLHKGKFAYDDLPYEPDYTFSGEEEGYIPSIVYYLAMALGGTTQTI